jgi:hypothetical protein
MQFFIELWAIAYLQWVRAPYSKPAPTTKKEGTGI